ncbi:BON domain-containing protein [Variovorax ginsengisoli]|uniref:Osmotically-inducible protein OsmY n=1 Tax=Variovorax ginsengisoli TaxID=363844 RepID=A0ABT9S632_9BURK|nr:BON domain-containing protein [Variovorax ginsengisoli]MDP9899811.1 osmotically-inducible protein OsmY [Variovorax ginsengisoli]
MKMTTESTRTSRIWIATAVACAALSLAACGDKSNGTTAGEKVDAAIAKTEQAGAEAKEKVDQMASEAKAKIDASTASGEATARQGATQAKGAIDDAALTASVSAGLAKDPDLSAIKINVDTKGGVVTLNGPAPSATAKARAEDIARSVQGVSSVDNRLEVKAM